MYGKRTARSTSQVGANGISPVLTNVSEKYQWDNTKILICAVDRPGTVQNGRRPIITAFHRAIMVNCTIVI